MRLLPLLSTLLISLSANAYLGTTAQKVNYVKNAVSFYLKYSEKTYQLNELSINLKPYVGVEASVMELDSLLRTGESDLEVATFILKDTNGQRYTGEILVASMTRVSHRLGIKSKRSTDKINSISSHYNQVLEDPKTYEEYVVGFADHFWEGRDDGSLKVDAKELFDLEELSE